MKEEAKKSEDSSDVKVRRKTKWKTIPFFQICDIYRLEIISSGGSFLGSD